MKKISSILLIILTITVVILLFKACNKPQPQIEIKTVKDTVYYTINTYTPKYFLKEIPVRTVDTLIVTNTDTIKVEIPITQKVYQDSAYTAYISGYKPSLDSINIVNKERVITQEKVIKEPVKGWQIYPAINIGYGLIHNQFDINVGVGITYKF